MSSSARSMLSRRAAPAVGPMPARTKRLAADADRQPGRAAGLRRWRKSAARRLLDRPQTPAFFAGARPAAPHGLWGQPRRSAATESGSRRRRHRRNHLNWTDSVWKGLCAGQALAGRGRAARSRRSTAHCSGSSSAKASGITTSGCAAQALVSRNPSGIVLVDGVRLAGLMVDHELGVTARVLIRGFTVRW